MEPEIVAVGGQWMCLRRWGSAELPALVLLHDLAESADIWEPVIPPLAEQFQVVAIDLRGHGDSDWIDTYSIQEVGDDIGELIELLRLAPAHVVGAGLGGRAAALLAARQEHHLASAVLIGVGVTMYLPEEREADEAILSMPRVYHSPGEYAETWARMRTELGLRRQTVGTLSGIDRLLRPLPSGGFAAKCDLDGIQRYREWSPGGRSVSYHDEFQEIMTPVLLMRGRYSSLLSPKHAAETADAIDGSQLVTVDDAAHDVLADNPDGLLRAMLPFLGRE